jgi:hypothetical protein
LTVEETGVRFAFQLLLRCRELRSPINLNNLVRLLVTRLFRFRL